MQLWLSLPPRLCTFLGEYVHQDEKMTWLKQAKSLTKCDLTEATSRQLHRVADKERKQMIARMHLQLNTDHLEACVVLFKLLGYSSDMLRSMDQNAPQVPCYYGLIRSRESWTYKRSMTETAVDYWPAKQREFFIDTFCITVADVQNSFYNSTHEKAEALTKFCKNTFRQIMSLDRKEAIDMVRYRGFNTQQYDWPERLGLVNTCALLRHLDAQACRDRWDDSKCSAEAQKCGCRVVESEFYFHSPTFLLKVKECIHDDIKAYVCNWLGVKFKGQFPNEDDVERIISMHAPVLPNKNPNCPWLLAWKARERDKGWSISGEQRKQNQGLRVSANRDIFVGQLHHAQQVRSDEKLDWRKKDNSVRDIKSPPQRTNGGVRRKGMKLIAGDVAPNRQRWTKNS